MNGVIKNIFRDTIFMLAGMLAGAAIIGRILSKHVKDEQENSDKHLTLYLMMYQWLKIKQQGKCLSTYLESKGYRKIAIYGMSYAGEALARELVGSKVSVIYGIDINADSICENFKVVTPSQLFEEVDAIVVTSVASYTEIKNIIKEKIKCPIISLEDIVYQI